MQNHLVDAIDAKLDGVVGNLDDESSCREIREARQFVAGLRDELDERD
ncbi:MAG: hypothetical protein ACI8UR_000254 [Natronomonas sp.]|jgi:hypothetical protein